MKKLNKVAVLFASAALARDREFTGVNPPTLSN